MISFLLCLALLIIGYFVYGKIVDNTFGPDDRETPAVRINDGVDYVVMPQWKLFLVQLLNIAGLGPIFGALQGALWGPVVFLWITFGTIFAGGVHDYFSGTAVTPEKFLYFFHFLRKKSLRAVCALRIGFCFCFKAFAIFCC